MVCILLAHIQNTVMQPDTILLAPALICLIYCSNLIYSNLSVVLEHVGAMNCHKVPWGICKSRLESWYREPEELYKNVTVRFKKIGENFSCQRWKCVCTTKVEKWTPHFESGSKHLSSSMLIKFYYVITLVQSFHSGGFWVQSFQRLTTVHICINAIVT